MPLPRWRPGLLDAAGIAVLASLTTAAWFFGISPMLRAHAAERSVETTIATLRRDLAAAEAAVEAARQRDDDARARLAAIDVRTDRPVSVNERLATIIDLAEQQGMTLDRVEPGQPTPAEAWVDVPIQLNGRCGPAELVAFLSALRTEAPETAVRRLSVQTASTPAGATLSVSIGAVWRGPKAAPSATRSSPAAAAGRSSSS